MKLIDLNIDCLEGILEYLKLEDLLNAADSNKRLCHASKFVFFGKYGSPKITFIRAYKSRQECLKQYKLIEVQTKNNISLNDLKSIFQILRNFGHLISKINFDLLSSEISRQTRIYIIDYVNYYCHESLNEIFIVMMNQDFLKCFKKPFIRVKTVTILSGFLMQKNSLVWSFPKMQNLEIMLESYATISESIVNHFPYLKHFKISEEKQSCLWERLGCLMLPENYKEDERIESFKAFLKLNPQLEHLYMGIKMEADFKILQVFGEREQNPKSLVLQLPKYPNVTKIHLKNIENLSICRAEKERIIFEIPFLCDKLESFEIDLDGQSDEYIYQFCHDNPTIRKLKFGHTPISRDFNINYLRLSQSLPFLEEMTVFYGKLSADEALHVLTQFKCLKYFCFCYLQDIDYQQLESRLHDWKISINNSSPFLKYITLIR